MGSNRLSIDTNIVIHAIVQEPRDQYAKACSMLSKEGYTYTVFDSAIIEAVYVFETFYEKSRLQIARDFTLFFEQFGNNLDYNKTITKMILPFWVEHPALSFTDCYLAFQSSLIQAEPLMTFDKKLASQHPSVKLLA